MEIHSSARARIVALIVFATRASRRIDARRAYLLLAIPSTMYILGLGLTPTWRSNMATKKKAKKKASKKK